MKAQGSTYQLFAAILRVGLVAALVWAGWSVYRRLPSEGPATAAATQVDRAGETELLIVLRRSTGETEAGAEVPVELVQTDLASVWREYSSEPRPGVRFEDFLTRHLKGRPTVTAQLDQRGQAAVRIAPGRWLLLAHLDGAESVEWRLPVNISGRTQTIELTPDNAYAKTKSF